jgi:hypothetical protein
MCIIHSYTAHCTALTKKARKLQTPNPRKKTDSPSSRYACLAICIVPNRPESRDGSNSDCSPEIAPADDLEMPWVCTLVFITSRILRSASATVRVRQWSAYLTETLRPKSPHQRYHHRVEWSSTLAFLCRSSRISKPVCSTHKTRNYNIKFSTFFHETQPHFSSRKSIRGKKEDILKPITNTISQTRHPTTPIQTPQSSLPPQLPRNSPRTSFLTTNLHSTFDQFRRRRNQKSS